MSSRPIVLVIAVLALAGPAAAEPVVLGGLIFSDERGGMRILGGHGSGTLADPFVVIEEITENGPAVLVIRGLDREFGNRIGSHHAIGFALTKLVRNATAKPWPLFELELREDLAHQSTYSDGLSFGQGSQIGRPFTADRFAEVRETQEPRDGISFSEGRVGPGQSVTISVVITEMTPEPVFYLIQKREAQLAAAPGGHSVQRAAQKLAGSSIRARRAPSGGGGGAGPSRRASISVRASAISAGLAASSTAVSASASPTISGPTWPHAWPESAVIAQECSGTWRGIAQLARPKGTCQLASPSSWQ